MKAKAKHLLVRILTWQLRRLRAKHSFKVVAIAGSIGKTSTKFAIAQLLGQSKRVRFQEGNYNVDLTIPLVFFGQNLPSLYNPFAWLALLIRNEQQIRGAFPFEIVIVELGTDGPGQMSQYAKQFTADIGVLTAIAPEHMEYFGAIGDVAKEEGVIAEMSNVLVYNKDLIDPQYVPQASQKVSYGTQESDHRIVMSGRDIAGLHFRLESKPEPWELRAQSLALAGVYSLTCAVVVAQLLDCHRDDILRGTGHVQPPAGRLRVLAGQNGSVIIDDTYNASPDAMKASLQALYDTESELKLLLAGNMNELGEYSAAAHAEVGALCDPAKLSVLVTLGADANKYLADAAEKRGCKVLRCQSPVEAANYIRPYLKRNVYVLAKGSQNGVFAEEAVKLLLADPADAAKLVRQSPHWLKRKRQQFKDLAA